MKTFTERLSYALEELDVSQSELGRRVGVKRQTIQWLCIPDGTDKKSKSAFQIAKALDVSPEWLILGEGVMKNEHS